MADSAKELAEVKSYLEKRLEELRREERLIESMLKLVDEALSSASFVKASELVAARQPEAAEARQAVARHTVEEKPTEESLVTATASGEHLARVLVYPSRVEIVFLKPLSSGTSPFQSFFVKKLLEGFKRQDEDLVARGEKSPDEVFDYRIEEEGGVLKRVVIENYGDKERVREIKSALRWTLNKMIQRS
ncbi:hypothetical protein [Thermofilum pendens]|uniref:Uncharacterized protein n=1 Tax=Thermofilum pendens (strain DSM 2475 / Hrk 5) TaxID=368408 RepID=A1RY73_THEPD|nr:hypothetical protein [Thermofilum pendens]ABL78153.1 hypothetical protein Tpen_0751 [Thermofilum pendens Hrk 5]